MKITVSILLVSIILGLQSCSDDKQLETKNQELRDSITSLNERLEHLRLSYSFRKVKPVIFNFDTTFTEGEKTEFEMYMVADDLIFDQHDSPLEFEFETNLKSELDLAQRRGYNILTYKPLETGKDTIQIEYFFRDKDGTKKLSYPVEYFVDVKK